MCILQTDIVALFAANMVVSLNELKTTKPYLILYVQKILTIDGTQLLVKLWFDSRKDVFFILPTEFSLSFTRS